MELEYNKITFGIFDIRFRERGISLHENLNCSPRAEDYWIHMACSFLDLGKSRLVILSSVAILTWRTGPPQVASHPCWSAEWRGSGSLFGTGPPLSEGSNRALLLASAPWGHLKERKPFHDSPNSINLLTSQCKFELQPQALTGYNAGEGNTGDSLEQEAILVVSCHP